MSTITKQQEEFLLNWAKTCKIQNDNRIPCVFTHWKEDGRYNITTYKTTIKIYDENEMNEWDEFFAGLLGSNIIKKDFGCSDGGLGVFVGANYIFYSQSVIDEIVRKY